MRCPVCGSTNVNVQIVTDVSLVKKGHGCFYWLCFGWLISLIMWIFFTLPMLIIRVIRGSKYKVKTSHSTMAVCSHCGHSWHPTEADGDQQIMTFVNEPTPQPELNQASGTVRGSSFLPAPSLKTEAELSTAGDMASTRTPKITVGDVSPFFTPDGVLRGHSFEGVVYATQEQAEAARSEKEARIVDGVLYATREQADEERARLAEIEARTIDGVLYATKEQAGAIRAERAEIEACTVDGVRYATREMADAVRAEMAKKAREEKEARATVVREAARAIEEKLYDAHENKMLDQMPTSVYCQNLRKDFTQRVEKWLALVNWDTLNKTKNEVQKYIDEQTEPQPLAVYFLRKIDKRLSATVAEQEGNQTSSPAQAPSQQPSSQPQKKSSSGLVVFFVVVLLGGLAYLYWAKQNKTGPFAPRVQYQNTPAVRNTPAPTRTPSQPQSQNDPEIREFRKDPAFVKAEKMLADVWSIVKAKYETSDSARYQTLLSEQKNWIKTGKRDPVGRAAQLLEQCFNGNPIREESYIWTGEGAVQCLAVEWHGVINGKNIVQVGLDVTTNNGFGGSFPGWGLIDSNGVGFICGCPGEGRDEEPGSMTVKILGSTAIIEDINNCDQYCGAGAWFWEKKTMRLDRREAPQSPAPDVPKLTGDRPLTRSSARKGYVTALGLNVRADHDNTSRIIAQAEQGASLSIVDEWRDYDSEYPWYKIDDLSEWGWVYGKYVTVNDGARIGLVTLKTGKMNIHTDHAKISPNIGTVEAGGRYQVAEIWTSKEVPYPWYCIIVDESIGSTGWVSGRYFKIDGLPSNEGYKLSDEEYNEFRQHVDFAAADDAMSIVWATIKDRASSARYAELLKGQKAWLAQRRDRMATSIFNKAGRASLPKRECYVRATQARIKELQAALNKL